MNKSLTLHALRVANRKRLPEFRNGRGELAHKKPDGSDWNPAQWLQALVGELGEFTTVRLAYESGHMSHEEYCVQAAKELADVQTYLDLLSQRCLDEVNRDSARDFAQYLMMLIASLGEYANVRKKFERGDISWARYDELRRHHLIGAPSVLQMLCTGLDWGATPVTRVHEHGVHLGDATVRKFNEVSARVECDVFLPEE